MPKSVRARAREREINGHELDSDRDANCIYSMKRGNKAISTVYQKAIITSLVLSVKYVSNVNKLFVLNEA